MTENLSFDEEAAAMEQIVRNQLAIAELEAQNALLKQFFKDRPESYKAGTVLERGKFVLRVTTNTRIDDKLAQSKLSIRDYHRVTKKVVDPRLARLALSDEQLDSITKKYDNKLIFGLADD